MILLLVVAGLGSAHHAFSATATEPPTAYSDLSLEELMDVSVTSVSKREQKLSEAAAAISVLSNEELRRTGATSVAEALRIVPGMSVGVINSSQWAVSARGFNGLYANKLLVLVDGRAVYSPTFSGVYWDLQQTPLEDIDRIEVIRGPGATVWGANAVNGVINVVTRSARDTQGGTIYSGGGDIHQLFGGARYGGRVNDDTYYRVFGSYQLNRDYPLGSGQDAQDQWQGGQGGFRLDRYLHDTAHLTWQADATLSEMDSHDSSAYDVNTLARWTSTFSPTSSLEVQGYFDRYRRDEHLRAEGFANTGDLTAQHTFGLGERNNVIWGVGYRYVSTRFNQTSPLIQVRDPSAAVQVFNAFLQDEFHLWPDRLTLTAGTKVEHNKFTGPELQPSIRLLFKPTEHQSIWAAASRATRTPNLLEAGNPLAVSYGAPFIGPGGASYLPTLVGNSSIQSETLWAYELGYRIQAGKHVHLDSALFFNRYSRLIGVGDQVRYVPGNPFGLAEIGWGNSMHGESYGGEIALTYSPVQALRLSGSYALLQANVGGLAAANPINLERSAPINRVTFHLAYDFLPQASADLMVRYEDQIKDVPAYLTMDFRLSYRLANRLEFTVVGQNLLDNQHPEQPAAPFAITSEVPRGFYGKITWRF